MVAAARVVGLLMLGFAGMGVVLTALSFDPAPLQPLWGDQLWTGTTRRAAEWAAYAALAAGGATLRIEPRQAVWPLALAVLLIAAMVGYDALVSDPDVARQRAMLAEDAVLATAAALGLFAVGLAIDEETGDAGLDA
jgi:hypothetical protein